MSKRMKRGKLGSSIFQLLNSPLNTKAELGGGQESYFFITALQTDAGRKGRGQY